MHKPRSQRGRSTPRVHFTRGDLYVFAARLRLVLLMGRDRVAPGHDGDCRGHEAGSRCTRLCESAAGSTRPYRDSSLSSAAPGR